jgi:hypothetical protein
MGLEGHVDRVLRKFKVFRHYFWWDGMNICGDTQ